MQFQVTEEILSLIIPVDKYDPNSHPKPYVYQLDQGGKSLYFFGAAHNTDPKSEMFVQLKNVFNDFQPEMVIVEGIGRASNPDTKQEFEESIKSKPVDEVIRSRAEPAFTVYECLQRELPWDSAASKLGDEVKYLLSLGYMHEEIFVWIALRQVYMYIRAPKDSRPSLDIYVQAGLNNLQEQTRWDDFDYSYQTAVRLTHEITEIDIPNVNLEELRSQLGPSKSHSANVYKRIWADSAEYVDRLCVQMIGSNLEKYDRVLVVFGAYHAVVQEPALRALMN